MKWKQFKIGKKSFKAIIGYRKLMSIYGGFPPYTEVEIKKLREHYDNVNDYIDEKIKGGAKR